MSQLEQSFRNLEERLKKKTIEGKDTQPQDQIIQECMDPSENKRMLKILQELREEVKSLKNQQVKTLSVEQKKRMHQ